MRVLDTSFVIDLSNEDRGAAKLAKIIDDEHSVAGISTVSVHEYFFGIHLRYFQEKEMLNKKLEDAEKELLAFMILPLTQEVSMESARIQAALTKKGRIIGINDIYIAATAIVHQAAVVTRNSSDFEQIHGLSVQEY